MTDLKRPVTLETTFDTYELRSIIGEGGAGRVYKAIASQGAETAIKVLTAPSMEKRRRFKNEIGFLNRSRHVNIVPLIDHGVAQGDSIVGPFYVMPLYDGSLRDLAAAKLSPEKAIKIFGHVLDGVEALHLLGVSHRDLKPENILFRKGGEDIVIADLGIADFTEELLHTLVETAPTQRLANFQYAAPEQRIPGREVTLSADIYALGLILNELFTGQVPHGTDYRRVEKSAPEFSFLDPVVEAMLRQSPSERPTSVGVVKGLIERHRADAISQQRLSDISKTVVRQDEIDDPLALEPPQLVAANWDGGTLHLTLDRPINKEWVRALHDMGSYQSVYGLPPSAFQFHSDTVASAPVDGQNAQAAVNHFKTWLPIATRRHRNNLEAAAARRADEHATRLQHEREFEEGVNRVNKNLQI